MNATLDTGGGAINSARNVTAVSEQTCAVAAAKAATSDVRGGARGEEFGIRVESRATAAATTGSAADFRRERAASRGAR